MPIFEPMRAAWEQRPFQGQLPEDAKVFFFGKDANYDANTPEDFLNILRQYHKNGVAYWLNNWHNNNNNDHHSFLLPDFRQGAGYKYHSRFRLLALPANLCAKAISFVKLLNVPTTGMIDHEEFEQHLQDCLQNGHIRRLWALLFTGRNKLVFMSDEVIRILRGINGQAGIANRLSNTREPASNLPIIYNDLASNITIRKNLHFSARYHQQQVLEQLPVISQCILGFLVGLH